jgi:hypothetical protein
MNDALPLKAKLSVRSLPLLLLLLLLLQYVQTHSARRKRSEVISVSGE